MSSIGIPAQNAVSCDGPSDQSCDQHCSLCDLRVGARARVLEVLTEGCEAMRLQALGLCRGREVEVLRTGEAWVVRVMGARIGLSRRLAQTVVMAAA